MGRGDKKTRKGKISKGSYGNTRKKKSNKPAVKKTAPVASAPAEKPKKTARKKTEA